MQEMSEGLTLCEILRDGEIRGGTEVGPPNLFASLARRATQSELKMAQQLLASYSGDENKALEDIWWALLNSNQFILNH